MGQKELKNQIANAETKADHERIAQYFDAEATKYEAEAKEHGELAPFIRKAGSSGVEASQRSAIVRSLRLALQVAASSC